MSLWLSKNLTKNLGRSYAELTKTLQVSYENVKFTASDVVLKLSKIISKSANINYKYCPVCNKVSQSIHKTRIMNYDVRSGLKFSR